MAKANKVGIVVPSLLKSTGLREQNLIFTLQRIKACGLEKNSVLSQQVGGEAMDQTPYVKKYCPGMGVVTFSSEDSKIHKSFLVNQGVDFLRNKADFIFQIDTDIHLPLDKICADLKTTNPLELPMVKPMKYFLRLSLDQSEKVRNGENFQVKKSDFSLPVSYPGAGSICFTVEIFDAIGGWDETMTGWGWEDVDFANRLKEVAPYKILPYTGFHLEHENDRLINKDNFQTYKERHSAPSNWGSALMSVMNKFAIFTTGRAGSTLLSDALKQHSRIHMYSADKNSAAPNTTELFNEDLVKDVESWTWENIIKRISEEVMAKANDKMAGFKIVMRQPNPKDYPKLSGIILNANNWKYIYLYRKNLFDQMCSWVHAFATNKWYGRLGDKAKPVEGDIVEGMKFIEEAIIQTKKMIELKSKRNKAYYLVSYESLVERWDTISEEIQQHLELPIEKLEKRVPKQRGDKQTWDKLLTNYEEIEDAYNKKLPQWRKRFPEVFDLLLKP
jgi:hypothetical protein